MVRALGQGAKETSRAVLVVTRLLWGRGASGREEEGDRVLEVVRSGSDPRAHPPHE